MDQKLRYMVLGDSNAACWPTTSGFRGLLDAALPASMYEPVGPLTDDAGLPHAGFIGATTGRICQMLPDLVTFRPDILILWAGGNALPDGSPVVVAEEIATICKHFLLEGTRLCAVCTLTDVRRFTDRVTQINAAIRARLDGAESARLVDVGREIGLAGPESALYADDVHPNIRGHEIIAGQLLKEVFGIAARPKDRPKALLLPDLLREGDRAMLDAYPGLSTNVRALAVAVGYLTTGLGQSGPWAPNGVPSNNWSGALFDEKRDVGFIIVGDLRRSRFPLMRDGASRFFNGWATPAMLVAASKLDFREVARLQGEPVESAPCYAEALRQLTGILLTPPGAQTLVPTTSVGATEAEPTGRPFSIGNVGVLLLTVGIFGATLALKPRHHI